MLPMRVPKEQPRTRIEGVARASEIRFRQVDILCRVRVRKTRPARGPEHLAASPVERWRPFGPPYTRLADRT